jgi:hypothetical protein
VMASHPDVEPLGMASQANGGHVGARIFHPVKPR